MKEENKIKKTLEKFNFSLEEMDAQTFTPLGEDWHITIEEKTIAECVKTLESYLECVDDETSLYIEERGKYGIPADIMALVKDGEWKKKTLQKIIKELKRKQRGV